MLNLNIAGNLKRLRKQRNLTQEELSNFIGVSFQAISKWECGDGYPDITNLPVLAKFFNVTVDELIGTNEIEIQVAPEEIKGQYNQSGIVERKEYILKMTLEELDMSIRSFNCLTRAGIVTVEDLINRTEEDMIKVRNLGKKSLDEVIYKLNSLGLSLMS